ncbi:MAG: trehalose phosphatase [Thiothrix sp.]|nr:MAG: trehalose phosphatase [Thiothrix sp.]
MKPILLTDLDDTLFQTARKMSPAEPKLLVAKGADGQALSFFYPWQQAFIDWALQQMIVIPVTARGIESFKRVQIPFSYGAVCLHGGVILTPQGQIDPQWQTQTQALLDPYQARLSQLLAQGLALGVEAGLSLRAWLEEVETTAVYVVFKTKAQVAELHQLRQLLLKQADLAGFYLHQNDNNLALIPSPISKAKAVAELIQRCQALYGRRPLFGMGDSLSDFEFMQHCDFLAFPAKSQLAEQWHE